MHKIGIIAKNICAAPVVRALTMDKYLDKSPLRSALLRINSSGFTTTVCKYV